MHVQHPWAFDVVIRGSGSTATAIRRAARLRRPNSAVVPRMTHPTSNLLAPAVSTGPVVIDDVVDRDQYIAELTDTFLLRDVVYE